MISHKAARKLSPGSMIRAASATAKIRTGCAHCDAGRKVIYLPKEPETLPWHDNGGAKVHPAQKPITVMEWCLRQAGPGSVLDPWMGAGSTGIAAVNDGRAYTGIEINPAYFDIACRRIADAVNKPCTLVV